MGEKKATRATDERLLRLLALRTKGLTLKAIAEQHGVGLTYIDSATVKIREADMAASPDENVAVAYWKTRKPRSKK